MSYTTSLSTYKYAKDNLQDKFFELIYRNLISTYGRSALERAGIDLNEIHHCSTEPESESSYKPTRLF